MEFALDVQWDTAGAGDAVARSAEKEDLVRRKY
jgi:hypothetical protein